MKHAEFRVAFPGPPLEPCDCPGTLSLLGSIFDPLSSAMIDVLVCGTCGHSVIFEPDANRIRNDYAAPLRENSNAT